MKEVIKQCPVCGSNLIIKKLYCENCETEINGNFVVERSNILDDEDWAFIKEFIDCDGNFRLLSERLGLSYPTLKIRLMKIKNKLKGDKENNEGLKNNDDIDYYLEKLEEGKMSVDEVLKNLKRSKK